MSATTVADLELPIPHSHPRIRLRSLAATWEAFKIAVDSVWSHKLRSVLTLLGVIIGVASVVTVGGAIEGLEYYVKDRLVSTFGSNTFIVARVARINLTYEEWEKLSKRNKVLHSDDLRAVEKNCDDCEAVTPMLRNRADVKVGSKIFYDANVQGVSADLPKIQQIDVEEGRFLANFDVEHARYAAIIGADIRDQLFGPIDVVGKEIKVGGEPFTILGVEKRNGSFFGQSLDTNIYIPYTVWLKKYGTRRSIEMRIKAPSAESMVGTQDKVRVIMRGRHKLRPNQEDDFDILASEAIQQSVGQFTGAIAAVVTPITLISLVVGGIVIMNIMLVTVTERTKEVGMRKAVGARRKDIMLQFLIESALLSSFGGVFGLLLAYGLSMVIRSTTPIPMTITIGYILLALVTSGGIGLISGIYPAHKAAKLDPIVALSRD
ncbi:MAG TPA: ABC transporter permease [Acidobacteriota bacterium]|nr:ABC transporter permease [Acidobacteriota bacterium]